MFKKIGLFILGFLYFAVAIILSSIIKTGLPGSIVVFFIIPIILTFIFWKKSRSLATGLLVASIAPILSIILVMFGMRWLYKDVDIPAKFEVIQKLEEYKMMEGKYPDALKAIELSEQADYGPTYFRYQSEGENFILCHHYAPYTGAVTTCFDSQINDWYIHPADKDLTNSTDGHSGGWKRL